MVLGRFSGDPEAPAHWPGFLGDREWICIKKNTGFIEILLLGSGTKPPRKGKF